MQHEDVVTAVKLSSHSSFWYCSVPNGPELYYC